MSTMIPVFTPGAELDSVRLGDAGDAPVQFLWQGRLHVVRAVLDHTTKGRVEEWRVWASAGRDATPRVFVLRFDWSTGRWTVFPYSPGAPDRGLPEEVDQIALPEATSGVLPEATSGVLPEATGRAGVRE